MNGHLSWKTWLGLVLAYFFALDASRGASISVQETGMGSHQSVTISSSTIGNNVGVYAGVLDVLVNGKSTYAFCVDPWHWSGSGVQTYSTNSLVNAPGNPAPMGADTALKIEQLWAHYYSSSMGGSAAAGLQIAIWDLVSASVSASTNGASWFNLNSSNDYGASTDLAWLAANPTAAAADLIGLTGPGQAYAVDNSTLPAIITSSLATTGKQNLPFSYAIVSCGHPTGYSASGLPSGLTVNTSTGVISGTPTTTGTYAVTIAATKSGSSDSVSLALTVTPTYTLALTASPASGGTYAGAGIYDPGTVVTITETPAASYRTAGWTGTGPAAPANATTTVTMNGNRSVTAQFVRQALLTVTAGAGGTATGSGTYDIGAAAVITASPSGNYAFTGWSGTGVANTGASSTTVTITGNEIVSAAFAQPPALTAVPGQVLVVGQPYSLQVNASNSPTFGGSGLPAGLAISGGGLISGTPTHSGSCSGTVTASNAGGSASETVAFTVYNAPTVPAASAAGKLNEPFSYPVAATGSPTSYSASGLPPGVSINPSTGVLSGTPTQAGSFPVAVTASNLGASGAGTVTVTVGQTYVLTVTPSNPNGGTATGAGIYDAGAVVTIAETANAGFRAAGWTGPDGSAAAAPSSATTTIVMSGNRAVVANFAQQAILTVTAGPGGTATGGGTYDIGAVVPISAAASGSYVFTGWSGTGISNSGSAAATVTITGNAIVMAAFAQPPSLAPTPAQTLVVGQPASVPVSATNASSFASSGLPPGLSIDPGTGAISGTPSAAGSWSAGVTASNVAGSASETVAFTVYDTPVITGPGSSAGKLDEPLALAVTASGSPTSYGASGLPPGLAINPATGAISGSPTQAGSFPVTLTASNPGATGSAAITLTVAPTYLLTVAGSSPSGGTYSGGGRYDAGTVVTLSETPAAGYRAAGWGGADAAAVVSASSPSTTITMNADRSVTANFVRQATLTVNAGAGGSAAGGGTYDVGSTVTITATAIAHYGFADWSGGATADAGSASTSVTLSGDETVLANFSRLPQPPSAALTAAPTAYTGSPFTVASTASAPDDNLTLHSIEWMSPTDGSWSANTAEASGDSSSRTLGITFPAPGLYTLRAGASVDGGATWVYSATVQVAVSDGIATYAFQTMAVPSASQLAWYTSSPVVTKTYQVKHVNP